MADTRYICGYCRAPIPKLPEKPWKGHLVLSCGGGNSRGCGRNAVDYGRYPVLLISYWDEKLEVWDETEVKNGGHRRCTESVQRAHRVLKVKG